MTSRHSTILVVDDQVAELESLSALLAKQGYTVFLELDADLACRHLNGKDQIDLLMSKMHLNGNGAGFRVLRTCKQCRPTIPVIAITPERDVESAVRAMREGASDCLVQPVDPDIMSSVLGRCLASLQTAEHSCQGTYPTSVNAGLEGVVGNSPAMRELFYQVARVAPTNSVVLLTGETGTGKDVLADAVHRLSGRSSGPFVAVNVAAVPDSLIESELFGHVKGAFTDAAEDRVGRFEAAEGGTLFIDEIGDLGRPLQAKLLRVLESRVVNRVGSNENIQVDARIIAATSRNLERMVTAGEFRQDLYYRLNVIRLKLPALRDRTDDILPLARYFLDRLGAETGGKQLTMSPELEKYFVEYDWPGNVRQLKNALESMAAMAKNDTLTLADLPHTLNTEIKCDEEPAPRLDRYSLAEIEKLAILQTLEKCNGNRLKAARQLGVSVRTLQRKLQLWNRPSIPVTPSSVGMAWESFNPLPV